MSDDNKIPLPNLEGTAAETPLAPNDDQSVTRTAEELEAVFDVPVEVSAILGCAQMDVGGLLTLAPGTVIDPAREQQRLQENLASLKAAEQAFSDRAQEVGVGPAFVEFGSEDAMNMGSGSDFTFGNTAIGALVGAGNTTPITWGPDKGALVATSGDLGVTWGFIRPKEPKPDEPAAFPFFTVWRKAAPDLPWRYVAE